MVLFNRWKQPHSVPLSLCLSVGVWVFFSLASAGVSSAATPRRVYDARLSIENRTAGAHSISMGARGPAGVHHGDLQQLGEADPDAQERQRLHLHTHVEGETGRQTHKADTPSPDRGKSAMVFTCMMLCGSR